VLRKRGIGATAVFDVLFLDRTHGEKVLASGLDHDDACAVARAESQRRGVGRMFLAGSETNPVGDVIVIVESRRSVA
jgi:hypothetical protein